MTMIELLETRSREQILC